MSEEKYDTNSEGSKQELPPSLDKRLRGLLQEKELAHFRSQLPEAFLNDASEGLDQIADDPQLDGILNKMNHQMRQHLHKKKKSERKPVGEFEWSYWAIIIILLLCIVAFLVIRLLLQHGR
jgi:hypothetical protein